MGTTGVQTGFKESFQPDDSQAGAQPREAVQSLSLEVFMNQLKKALGSLIGSLES